MDKLDLIMQCSHDTHKGLLVQKNDLQIRDKFQKDMQAYLISFIS